MFLSGRLNEASRLSSVSNIRPDEAVIPSGCPSVSRSFELFKVASVRTFQQLVRTLVSVRQEIGFPSQTERWEDSCIHPDVILNKAICGEELQPFGRQGNTVQTPILIIKITWSRSATVQTLRQHRLDAALIWHYVKRFMKNRLHSCPFGRSQLPSGRYLEKYVLDLF